jgi:hypothetical protein
VHITQRPPKASSNTIATHTQRKNFWSGYWIVFSRFGGFAGAGLHIHLL